MGTLMIKHKGYSVNKPIPSKQLLYKFEYLEGMIAAVPQLWPPYYELVNLVTKPKLLSVTNLLSPLEKFRE